MVAMEKNEGKDDSTCISPSIGLKRAKIVLTVQFRDIVDLG